MRRANWALVIVLAMRIAAYADSGVLVPTDKQRLTLRSFP